MHEDTFDPFALSLDKHIALNLLQTATQGADDGELFFERRRSETLVLDDQRIKTANFDASEGFGLRAVRGEKNRLWPFKRDFRGRDKKSHGHGCVGRGG